MQTVILVVHILLAISLVVIILLQRSDGGALSGLGGGGGGGLVSSRSAGNLLTRITAILGTCFMITSIVLALMARSTLDNKGSILDKPAVAAEEQDKAEPAKEEVPAEEPSAPLSE